MDLGILLLIISLYLNKKVHNCYCMNFLYRSFSFLSPIKSMVSESPLGKFGTTLSAEALSETLTTHKSEKTSLKKLLGELPPGYKGLVLFLFPSAGTPGCTKQACNFTSNYKAFKDKGYEVYGLTSSERTPAWKWTEKHNLSFTTLVDKEMKVVDHLDCRKLGLFVHRSHLVLSKEGKVLAFEKGVNAGTSVF
uniref:Ahp/TSA family-related protein, putative n=1 Tax=Theileria annulata TaxID=5874 RepID=A0A3B0N058_THEAN